MKKKISVIVGGSKGHGYEIIKELKKRGDYIINIARTTNKNANENINVNLIKSSFLKILKKKIKSRKINSLVFSQKYRGNDFNEEIQVMVKASIDIIDLFKKNFNLNSSVVLLSSIAIKRIADQNVNYYISQASRDILSKYFAIKFKKNKVRFNTILPSRVIKRENKNYFKKNKKVRDKLIKINPLNNIPTSKDTAMLVDFLTSDKSKMINGETISVDGGLNLYGQEQLINDFSKK